MEKSNAFLFKYIIENKLQTCLCFRVNDSWDKDNIVFLSDVKPELSESIDDSLFNVVFVSVEPNDNTYKINYDTSYYLKSDTITVAKLIETDMFFQAVEKGYQHFYGKKENNDKQI